MAAERRPLTIAGLMTLTLVVALVLALPRLALEPWFPAAMVGVWVALIYGLTPIRLRRTHRHPMSQVFRPFDPFAPDVPEPIASRFRLAASGLESLGFAPRSYFRVESVNASILFSGLGVFEEPRTGEVAKILLLATRIGVTTTLVFQTTFADGTEVVTSDGTHLPPWPRRDGLVGAVFPEIPGAGVLLAAHRALAGRAGGSPDRRLPKADDDLPDFLREEAERNLAWPVAIGFYEPAESAGVYRFTWKGALWNAWGRLWPAVSIRRTLRRRQAARTLRELGLDGVAADGPARA